MPAKREYRPKVIMETLRSGGRMIEFNYTEKCTKAYIHQHVGRHQTSPENYQVSDLILYNWGWLRLAMVTKDKSIATMIPLNYKAVASLIEAGEIKLDQISMIGSTVKKYYIPTV